MRVNNWYRVKNERGLDEFATLSGLHVNPGKSHLILSKAAQVHRTRLLEGVANVGYPKVAWSQVCKPVNEGGMGVREISALNLAMISHRLWEVVIQNRDSLWVQWIYHFRLRNKTVWTVSANTNSWGWRKMLRLQVALLPHVLYHIGDGGTISLWHDPWHQMGPLILRFPTDPTLTNTSASNRLNRMISNVTGSGRRIWIMWTLHMASLLSMEGPIELNRGGFTNAAAYALFHPPSPKVGWSLLLLRPLKIPRNMFILWLAILGHLSTLDKLWLAHLDGRCTLCTGTHNKTHQHLFFDCLYSQRCITAIWRYVKFHGHVGDWRTGRCGPRDDGGENM
ncbi:UNVERIFIED_CONTAM: hypothetical protein Slati_0175000 [Sesamum latifolium]|uniref:Reverse transcriptase zinc-binding domain-containing protein n=1 Tax=Sesamum latifolium TaxID=2727402 RepID=A0AAW2YAU8_9LAMI